MSDQQPEQPNQKSEARRTGPVVATLVNCVDELAQAVETLAPLVNQERLGASLKGGFTQMDVDQALERARKVRRLVKEMRAAVSSKS